MMLEHGQKRPFDINRILLIEHLLQKPYDDRQILPLIVGWKQDRVFIVLRHAGLWTTSIGRYV